ncbi:MAG: 3-oxoacyl-ACP reductase FabG [Acidobacteria bacterium]|nr:3-oxoacyl-ACP reductase FabG [Acidobacteriota bacterium]
MTTGAGSAIVTGGAGGIGLAVAHELARAGHPVGVVDAAEPAAGALSALDVEGRPHRFVKADVRSFAAAESAVREIEASLGPISVLVACAGISRDRASWRMTEEEWREVLDVNLTGAFTFARAVVTGMRERAEGRIVFISSINGLRGKFGLANYSASKAGLVGLTMTLARELGPRGITVNAVAPGFIRTGLTAKMADEHVEAARRESALGRLGEPEDVAAAVGFLCSARAGYITGQVIQVDGGQNV